MSLTAYQKTQSATEDARTTEYRLFGLVTGALMEAAQEQRGSAKLVEAVDWNRRLWNTLASDCSDDQNRLTPQLRAQIISLSLWVGRYSSQVIRGKAAIDPLVDINRTIMQGLAPQAPTPPSNAPKAGKPAALATGA